MVLDEIARRETGTDIVHPDCHNLEVKHASAIYQQACMDVAELDFQPGDQDDIFESQGCEQEDYDSFMTECYMP